MNKSHGKNLVPNADFQKGRRGELPAGWEASSPCDLLKPVFELTRKEGQKALLVHAGKSADSVGWLTAKFAIERGRTYRMEADLEFSQEINPQFNLLFACYVGNFNNGIFAFHRISRTQARGQGRFFNPGEGPEAGEYRIYWRGQAKGKAWIRQVSLVECEPIPARWVRMAATQGNVSMEAWGKVLDAVGRRQVDLALLPETFNQAHVPEAMDGPSPTLMAGKAKEYGMFVAGSFLHQDPRRGMVFNACTLHDRNGKRVGRYDKHHPYSPEWFNEGVSPGRKVEVFDTELGRIGMIICYDSWFTDVTELLALKGAELVLFPNAGYYRGLMPARSNDNGVRFVVSSLGTPIGIWDTSGADVEHPGADPTRAAGAEETFRNVGEEAVEGVRILYAELDLSKSPSAHNWGGPMLSAPGGRRNRREQRKLLYQQLQREVERWWEQD